MPTTESLIAEISATLETRPVQMPMPWAASARAMPTEFIAASVFTALKRGDAPNRRKLELIGEWNGYRLLAKGTRLTQVHADVWYAIMEIAKWQSAGSKVVFTARQLLRIMGRGSDTASRKQLHEWITDMQTSLVEITMPRERPGYGDRGYGASVIPEAAREERSDGAVIYSLVLHRVLCEAFARGYSLVAYETRRKLGRNELALWLHQYITAFPMAVPLDTLRALSGAPPTQRLSDFRRKLTVAMKALERVGFVTRWTIAPGVPEQLVAEQPKRLPEIPRR